MLDAVLDIFIFSRLVNETHFASVDEAEAQIPG